MRPLNRTLIWIHTTTVALIVWSLTAATALAETRPGATDADSGKSYVMPYFLVVLTMALGIIIVCRSANRSTELRRSDDDD